VLWGIGVLNLDCYMMQLIFIFCELVYLLEDEPGVLCSFDVAAHSDFRLGDGPDMKSTNLHLGIAFFDLLNHLFNVDFSFRWCAFH
jgi:hypothetical protein